MSEQEAKTAVEGRREVEGEGKNETNGGNRTDREKERNGEKIPDQSSFLYCYRGHHSPVRHAAYMRMSKVLLTQTLLERNGIGLEDKSLLDYGFGAGTFFRYCPLTTRIFGVELDPINVMQVKEMLELRGHGSVELAAIDVAGWDRHPLLQRTYDIILCSHVLEHLPEPEIFLRRISECLEGDGRFIGLIPINERRRDPHHVQELDRAAMERVADRAGLRVLDWHETDHWLYWVQPIFTRESGLWHKAAQAASLALGVASVAAGHRVWFWSSGLFGSGTGSKPTQAGFVLCRK